MHRTPALAMLRRAVLEGRPATFRMGAEERELAFHDAQVPLTSPIGARVLLMLYHGGQLRLKKPPQKSCPRWRPISRRSLPFAPRWPAPWPPMRPKGCGWPRSWPIRPAPAPTS
ncbi:MAG: hypothetical protein U5N10_02540 [Gemmobacter sp.]|nr:hypothetical protein [Gemmobacter sp.]